MSWVPTFSGAARGLADPLGRDRSAARATAPAVLAIITTTTVLGLVLRLYQLTRPNYLFGFTGYDDGVDFGSALRLVDGVLPYRDFAFVQPPGITWLMTPIALLSKAVGTDTAFAVARVMTACAGAASVALVGRLLRHRGAFAVTVACGIAAVHPDAVFAASSVLLEPWLVLFCLAGAVALFDGDDLTSSSGRLVLGGAAFGFAGVVKVWAILPVVVLLAICWRRIGFRQACTYAGGVVAGFVLPLLPFLAVAARSLFHDVVTVQLSRTDLARAPIYKRLVGMAGLRDLALGITWVLVVSLGIAAVLILCAFGARLAARCRLPALDTFALGTLALVFLAFLWPSDYYVHYGAFFAVFLALSLVLPAMQLTRPRAGPLIAIVLLAVAAMAVVRFHAETRLIGTNPGAAVAARIPPGACVVTDDPALAIIAKRFSSSDPRCPKMIDPVGTDYVVSGGRNALGDGVSSHAIQLTWLMALHRAQFVWLTCFPPTEPICNRNTNRRIPLAGVVGSYFAAQFRPMTGVPAYVFERSAAQDATRAALRPDLQSRASGVLWRRRLQSLSHSLSLW